ncbi:xanthine dehydrogenase accessory protein XdhC [Dasania marina]|uniref:xanthine dehydrogenase accessory protein XdhC n=1 Tax=Dasania marina TaxID=471499 RepID=UPI0030DD491C|tara:strand:- start:13619 stop:14533 length:915 start_codon:yes stop_codon:yes gene_type:complete
MAIWHEIVSQLEAQGTAYVLITVVGARGSTPRNSGTKMVVSENDSFCTIGGGHLEYQAIATAQKLLRESLTEQKAQQKIEHFPLGAKLGQCCGGSATLLFESFIGAELNIMLFGAGHVGKSLAGILAQLPCKLYWVDGREKEFLRGMTEKLPSNVIKVINDCPADEVAKMPANSYYIVMTHNHPLDFDITETILKRGDARYVGLIGSDTKWQRFQMRFQHRQHDQAFYAPVKCPAGLSNVPGKLPVEVAVSIAGEIIASYQQQKPETPTQQGISWRELKNEQLSQQATAQTSTATALKHKDLTS